MGSNFLGASEITKRKHTANCRTPSHPTPRGTLHQVDWCHAMHVGCAWANINVSLHKGLSYLYRGERGGAWGGEAVGLVGSAKQTGVLGAGCFFGNF